MSVKAGLVTYLKTVTAVTDLIGSGDSCRLRFGVAREGETLPYVVINRVSSGHESHLRAAGGLTRQVYQFDVYDDDSLGCDSLAEALRGAFDGFGPDTMGSTDVREVRLIDESDELIPATDGGQVARYRTRMDFAIWHTESVPTFA